MRFDWDPNKRRANIEKHGVDFVDAVEVFAGPYVLMDSPQKGEDREVAIGLLPADAAPERWSGYLTTIAFHRRGETIRLISARRARKDEREQFQRAYPGRR